jgi:hypothetical protein
MRRRHVLSQTRPLDINLCIPLSPPAPLACLPGESLQPTLEGDEVALDRGDADRLLGILAPEM